MGLTVNSGDVDLLGHETGETLSVRQNALKHSIDEVNEIRLQLEALEANISSVKDLPLSFRSQLIHFLLQTLQRISCHMFSVREIRKKKEYCKAKLIERGGESDWRKGKYVYAVSAIIAFLYDIDEYLKKAYVVTEHICITVASLNDRKYVSENSMNIHATPSFIDIDEQKTYDGNPSENTRFIKQRSSEWFDLRKKVKVTGSTLYTAIGGDTLKRQKDHFEKVICSIKENEPTQEQKNAMEHGVANEINAVTTIVGKVIPVLEPTLTFCEEGCISISTENNDVFMVVSPDGSLREDACIATTKVGIEVKCPYYKVHTEFPARYLLQCLSEIEVLQVNYLLFVSWTVEDTVVFKVDRDEGLFKEAMKMAYQIYGIEKVKKPTKLSDEQKKLFEKIKATSKSISVVARFSSLVSSENSSVYALPVGKNEEVKTLLQSVKEVMETHYDIKRERASEAVVFIVSDLDRSWDKASVKWSPVLWFPKGYSLTTESMRAIAEDVHCRCHEKGIHVPCASFDGQWHVLVVRSKDGKPLTKLQLQKDVWKQVVDMKKCDIIAELKKINKLPRWEYVMKFSTRDREIGNDKRRVIETSNEAKYPAFRRVPKSTTPIKDSEKQSNEHKATLADILPEKIVESGDTDTTVLKMATLDDDEDIEAFCANINEDIWAEELTEISTDVQDTADHSIMSVTHVHRTSKERTNSSLETNVTIQSEFCDVLNEQDMNCILALFKTTKDCNKNGKWDNVTPIGLRDFFETADSLILFLDVEIRAIVRYLKKSKGLKIKESNSKQMKINGLCKYLNLKCQLTNEKRLKLVRHTVRPLSEMAIQVISKKLSKQELNVWYSEYIWPDHYKEWCSNIEDVTINGTSYPWFYKPEYSNLRKQLEVRCVDSSHLLTRSRQRSCKRGLHGFSNEPWRKVAETGKTLLTKIMVDEVTDPMSVPMAATHFSESVESIMRNNGDGDCADLCQDIRNWWTSEDTSGIPANERIKLREGLRLRLLGCVDLEQFPPPTVSINGWPIQLWEALLSSIDAKALLYALCHGGAYNVRSFSSMLGETFFSELVLSDKRGKGTVSCQEFGQFIGNTIEKVQARLNPDRCFSYRNGRSHVYNLVEETEQPASITFETCRICEEGTAVMPRDIVPVNHAFDSAERRKLKGRNNMATVSTSRTSLQLGALGVRWERARRNESKMLPTDKMGI